MSQFDILRRVSCDSSRETSVFALCQAVQVLEVENPSLLVRGTELARARFNWHVATKRFKFLRVFGFTQGEYPCRYTAGRFWSARTRAAVNQVESSRPSD